MHCVVDRKPSAENRLVVFGEQGVKVNVDLANGVVRAVRVMVQHSAITADQWSHLDLYAGVLTITQDATFDTRIHS